MAVSVRFPQIQIRLHSELWTMEAEDFPDLMIPERDAKRARVFKGHEKTGVEEMCKCQALW